MPPPCPNASTDMGKPAATKTRRQVVSATRGHRASSAPIAVGKASTAQGGLCLSQGQARAQAAAQLNKAGAGQGKVRTNQS